MIHNRWTLASLFAATMLLTGPPAHAQLEHKGPAEAIAMAAKLPPYDVVSIKINKTEEDNFGANIHEATLTATNVPLLLLIEFAYDLKEAQISGLTGPVASARFDIEAKVVPQDGGHPPKLTDTQLSSMIIPLLADRFHLQAHLAPKTLPVYDLVVARGGLRIKLSQEARTGSSWNLNGENTSKVLTSKTASMADLAQALSDEVGRQVIDKTGLTGSADITLKWSDEVAAEQGGPNVISIFTAVEDQLGLKLQPSKGPVDTLVIDHVEMPSAD